MAGKDDYDLTFSKLRGVLEPYAPKLVLVADTSDNYYLDTARIMKNKKPLFFGAVRKGKSSVSFHLMPLYLYPDLLEGASPELKKHMRPNGKACFNFRSVDGLLLKELAKITKAGFAKYKAEKYV